MLLTLINTALSKYFAGDPETASELQTLEGKKLVLALTDLKKEFLVCPAHSSVVVTHYDQAAGHEITATVRTNAMALLRLGLGANYQAMLKDASLTIDGDAEFANQLRMIFMQVDIDFEEIAANYVGDGLAYQLATIARRARSYQQRSARNFCLDVREYLQEESRITPTRVEVERFLDEVDHLDADIERLEARIRNLLKISGA